MQKNIVIIGGGLTGVTLAYLLRRKNIDATILEARPRLGGRVFTKMSGNHIPIDMGAAWLWDYNPRLKKLLDQLQIGVFSQTMDNPVWYQSKPQVAFETIQVPSHQTKSYRIDGGSTNLILSLAATLNQENIHLNTVVKAISYNGDEYKIETNTGVFNSDLAAITLPPALAAQLDFTPALPANYLRIATQTHTWMQDSIKFGLGFNKPFWDSPKRPITTFSSFSIISEVYNYSNLDKDRFAIMGFLQPQAAQMTASARKEQVLGTLASFLGNQVYDHVSYEEYLWGNHPTTKAPGALDLPPHHNNGARILRSNYNQGSLLLAGSETSSVLAGYMEGAVNSALETFERIMRSS